MTNDELKSEVDTLILGCILSEILAVYPDWFIAGSYSYDPMCWRDLDIYVLDHLTAVMSVILSWVLSPSMRAILSTAISSAF